MVVIYLSNEKFSLNILQMVSYVQNIRINMFSQNEGSSYTKCTFFNNSQALASVFT